MCLTSDHPNLYEDPQRPGYKTPVRCGPPLSWAEPSKVEPSKVILQDWTLSPGMPSEVGPSNPGRQ